MIKLILYIYFQEYKKILKVKYLINIFLTIFKILTYIFYNLIINLYFY